MARVGPFLRYVAACVLTVPRFCNVAVGISLRGWIWRWRDGREDAADLSPRLIVVFDFVVGEVLSWCRQPLDRAKPVSSPHEGAD